MKPPAAAPPPDTEYEAREFAEIQDRFVIVAHRRQNASRDGWAYTLGTREIPHWHAAVKAGTVICVQQRRDTGVILLGKVA